MMAKEMAGEELTTTEIKALLNAMGPAESLTEERQRRIWQKIKAIADSEGWGHELENR
jgi:hypothetical protein